MKLEEAIKSTRFSSMQEKAAINLLHTAYWLKSNYSAQLKSEGLTLEQFNVLRILKGKHPERMNVKDICGRMVEKSSNVPRIIDRLVKKSLVKRATSKEDKRETLISLTDSGIAQLLRANELVAEVNNGMLGLNDDEARMLNELLEKLRAE